MLPNPRQVPEFRLLSSLPSVGLRRCACGACERRATVRSKALEADYVAAVRGL